MQIRSRVGIAPHIAAVGADALAETVMARVVGGERAHLRQIEHGAGQRRPVGRRADGMGAGGAADIQRRAAGAEGNSAGQTLAEPMLRLCMAWVNRRILSASSVWVSNSSCSPYACEVFFLMAFSVFFSEKISLFSIIKSQK